MNGPELALRITWSGRDGSRQDLLGMVKAKEMLPDLGTCNILLYNLQSEAASHL